jgi:hypothetical protein
LITQGGSGGISQTCYNNQCAVIHQHDCVAEGCKL